MKKLEKKDTNIDGLYVIEPIIFSDERGCFFEGYNRKNFFNIGIDNDFVQDNISISKKGVIRGLHFQNKFQQAKLIRVLSGKILDIVVDLRENSLTFGKYFSIELSEENKKMLYIPKGFAHGFLTLVENTQIIYKCDEYHYPKYETGIIWNDKSLKIDWNLKKYNLNEKEIILSEKDKKLKTFKEHIEKGGVS